MRHRKAGLKLNRTTSHRKAMFRNMVTSLFKYERIQTTDTRAKELRRWADHLITLAKRGDLHARRLALAVIREKEVVHKLFEKAPAWFGSISGGYTRIVKTKRRPGDAAPISIIELVSPEKAKKKKSRKKKKGLAKEKESAVKEKKVAEPTERKPDKKTKGVKRKDDSIIQAGKPEKRVQAVDESGEERDKLELKQPHKHEKDEENPDQKE